MKSSLHIWDVVIIVSLACALGLTLLNHQKAYGGHDIWGSSQLDYQSENLHIRWIGHGVVVEHASGQVILKSPENLPFISPAAINDGIVKGVTIRFHPQVKLNSRVMGEVSLINSDDRGVVYAIKLDRFCRQHLIISFLEAHSHGVDITAKLSGHAGQQPYEPSCEGLSLALEAHEDEHFIGLGTQATLMKLNGHILTTFSQEQGHGRGLQPLSWILNHIGKGIGGDQTTSYHTVPHVISNQLRSFWLNTTQHAHFDFSQSHMIRISPTSPEIKLRMQIRHSIKDLVRDFAHEFGTTKPLPDWSHRGAMMGLQGGEDHIKKMVNQLRKRSAPISSVWIQDWMGSIQTFVGQRLHWQWQTDTTLYPNWNSFVTELTDQGLQVVSYFNPRIKDTCSDNSCAFQTAKHNNYLVKNRLGQPYLIGNGGFNFAKIDLFHPEAREWLAQMIRIHFQQAPIKGWMADFSEATPLDAVLANNTRGSQSHNRYIYEWARLNGQLADEIDDGFVFMRGGLLGSHRHVHAFWLGDQLTTWDRYDGLHSTIIGLITSGLSGALVNHSDIGGLSNLRFPLVTHIKRTKELFHRWMHMNAFTPIFRTHEGLRPDQAHQFHSDEQTFSEFVRYAKIYASLFEYRQELARQTQEGLPMVRGMFFEYPHLKQAWQVDDQFMLGDELIVAPIVVPQTTGRSVYLPPGCWIEVFSQQIYNISTDRHLFIEASEHHIPVLARFGSQSHQLLKTALHQP